VFGLNGEHGPTGNRGKCQHCENSPLPYVRVERD
jgi:hypothetical protein